MLAIELFRAEHVSQSAHVRVIDLLPRVDNLRAALIQIPKSDDAL